MSNHIITQVMLLLKINNPDDIINSRILSLYLMNQIGKINKIINVIKGFNINICCNKLLKEKEDMERMLTAIRKIPEEKILFSTFLNEYLNTYNPISD